MQLSEILAILIPVATGLLGVCCMALGWFAGKMYDRLQKTESDLGAHKLNVAENYVPYHRLLVMLQPMDRMERALLDIQVMLAQKADRSEK